MMIDRNDELMKQYIFEGHTLQYARPDSVGESKVQVRIDTNSELHVTVVVKTTM